MYHVNFIDKSGSLNLRYWITVNNMGLTLKKRKLVTIMAPLPFPLFGVDFAFD